MAQNPFHIQPSNIKRKRELPSAIQTQVLALLSGEQTANCGFLHYVEAAKNLSLEPWVSENTTTNFYNRETELLNELEPQLRNLAPRGMPVVDLGPGGPSSVRRRAARIVQSLEAKLYLPVDISEAFLQTAAEVMGQELPSVKTEPIWADFFETAIELSVPMPRCVYMGGSTISNLPVFDCDSFPDEPFRKYLSQMYQLVGAGGYLLLGWHAAAHGYDALAPYQGAEAQYYLQTPLRVLKEWGAEGASPDNWENSSIWYPGSRCVAHGFTAIRDCTITFAGQRFSYKKDHRLIITPSYKISTDKMLELLTEAGFLPISMHGAIGEYVLWLFRSCSPQPGDRTRHTNPTLQFL